MKPPAGEWVRVSPSEFSRQWAAVVPAPVVRVSEVLSVPVVAADAAVEAPVEPVKKAGRPKKVVS